MTGSVSRRRLLAAAGALACARVASAQPGRSAPGITVAQVYDASAAQQDVSKDFLVGTRAFWQDLNARGGVRGRHVQHLEIEVDGTPASLQRAVATLRDSGSCQLLCGTTGDAVATALCEQLRHEDVALAHVAPWLQDSSLAIDERTFPIFAARQAQVAHALRTLTVMGVQDVGAVFATARDQQLYRNDLERIAASMRLRLVSFNGEGDVGLLAQRLTPGTPAILLFIGGTPELVQFTQGLERQQRQRYIVALADVNLQTVMQMGGARTTPLIVTQAVPLTTAALPVVRQYRDVLSRLFDEPPAPLSLAGFIAARYAHEVLREVDVPTRAGVLAAFQRRGALDIGGYAVAFDGQRRSGSFVTQSMLTQDGRVLG